jgi:hypothetical protein
VSRRTALAGLVAALSLAAPTTATAADFCLGVGAHCPSGAAVYGSLKAAGDAVSFGGGGSHRVFIGPGEWPGGAIFMRSVEVIGSGVGTTTITEPAPSATPIILGSGGSTVRDLTVRLTGTAGINGVKLDGSSTTLERVRISARSAVAAMHGVFATMGGTLRDVTIDFPETSPAGSYGVALPRGTLTVTDSDITAGTAIDSAGTSDTVISVVRSRLAAARGISAPAGTLNVAASSIRVLPGTNPTGIAFGNGPASATANLHGLTIAGTGASGIGIRQTAVMSGSTSTLAASGIVFAGGLTRALRIERPSPSSSATTNGQLADFAVPDRFAQPGGLEDWLELSNAGGVTISNRRFITDTALRDLAGGDLRPRIDSELVDAGGLAALPGWAGATDLLAGARTVDGDGDGTAARDIGAVEYVPQAPVVTATATAAGVGEDAVFTARVSDDPGDTSTVTWRFADGSTATGTTVRRSFAGPGDQRATATATDSTGLTGAGAATATVTAPPAPPPPAPAAAAASSADPAGDTATRPSSSAGKRARLAFGRLGKLKLRRGRVAIPVRCDGACSATLTLRTAGRKPAVLGRASFKLTRAGARTVTVKLTRSGLRRLRRARTTRISVALRAGNAAELRRAASLQR